MAEIEREARTEVSHAHFGMILFLVSETFLFGALFWTYYYLRANNSIWPPQDVNLNSGLATINTVLLLSSSGSMWWATRAIRQNKRNGLAAGLLITIILGTAFLTITGWEWAHETFRPWSHAYGSIFYTLTGFHALHVFGGVTLMVLLSIRAWRNRFSPTNYLPLDVGSLYWHFVDFIWLIVFTSIFIIR
jgi:cytochrome c oxidase subunit III